MFSSRSVNSSSTARLAIAALLATFLVATPWAQSPASASSIVYNNGVCNLQPTELLGSTYAINDADELWEIADCSGVNKVFVLQDDIDVTEAVNAPTSSPIGTSTSAVAFTGTLDGNNKSITGISISSSAIGVGLIALLSNATIRNLRLEGEFVYSGSGSAGTQASGALAVRTTGNTVIENVVSSGFVGGGFSVGGFIGFADGQIAISNSQNTALISGRGETGGFVGFAELGATISESTNSGDVVAADGSNASSIGGLLGFSNGLTTITNSGNEGEISGTSVIGGLVGYSDKATTISNSTNTGTISATSGFAGGFVAQAWGAVTITDGVNDGPVSTSGDRAAGFVAQANGNTLVLRSENNGVIDGRNNVGGLIGEALNLTEITSSSNEAPLSGDNFVGGLIGQVASSAMTTISHAVNSGTVVGNGQDTGGLVGVADADTSIYRSINSASVSSTGPNEKVGGLVGRLTQNAQLAVEESFNSGAISGGEYAGGFGGDLDGPVHILNSFNSGAVVGDNAGGFGVKFRAASASNSYQVGTVTSSQNGDPLFLDLNDADPVFESVYTNQTSDSGFPTSTDEQLQQKATYVDWDFDDVWGFVCGTNNNFPVLRFANPTSTAEECSSQAAGAGSAGAAAPAPTYTGPTLVSQAQPVAAGSSVTFTGSKLDVVTKAMIGTTEVQITSQTATSLTITVPATLAAATYDLVLFSNFGTLSVMGAVTISGVQAESVSQAQLLGWSWTLRFQGNSRSLSPAQDSHLRARVLAQPNATTVICWGYTTASSPNAWAIAHATQRAEAACNLVAAANSEVKTVVRLRYGVEKSSAMRSAVQFWR